MVLTAAFVERIREPERERFAAYPQLEDALAALVDSASTSWPDLAVPAEEFVAYLAERISLEHDVDEALAGLRAVDLYLACALVRGDDGAAIHFDRAFASEFDTVFARMRVDRATGDEVRQTIRERLLVARGDSRPKIATYAGRGDLRSWVRASIVREVISRARKTRREVPVADPVLAAFADDDDTPEALLLKRQYRTDFKAAFEAALAGLSSRERTLLQYKFADELNIDEIGEIYGVHRATAARWLGKIRDGLFAATRERLMARLDVDAGQLDSILRLIESRLDASITTFLRVAPDHDSEP